MAAWTEPVPYACLPDVTEPCVACPFTEKSDLAHPPKAVLQQGQITRATVRILCLPSLPVLSPPKHSFSRASSPA